MGKRLKFRLSRVISYLNSSCRSKNPSNLPRSPLPSTITTTNTGFFMLSPVNPKALDIDFPHSRHVSSSPSVFSSLNRWIKRGHPDPDPDSDPPFGATRSSQNQQFRWRQEEKWHVVAKVNEPPDTPSSPRQKLCNSSASDYDDSETQSLQQSAESHQSQRKKKKKKKKMKSRKKYYRSRGRFGGDETESLVSSSGCASKVKESFAVVKRSEDPYEDFKGSMLEMILAKEMFNVGDLEELLHCFLALNSRRHHGVIVEAFSDIWAILFCE
ncbi:hypothetical protein Sjap_016874 [Stephania japonica]|uniref:Transcription repressor n=1 Tax=Stephania japonica TaxID=461633 RepID=A0AAP0I536_9MAGN